MHMMLLKGFLLASPIMAQGQGPCTTLYKYGKHPHIFYGGV